MNALGRFLSTCFHQDWVCDDPDDRELTARHQRAASAQAISMARRDLDELLGRDLGDVELRRILLEDLGCSFSPVDDAQTWLSRVRDALIEEWTAACDFSELSALRIRSVSTVMKYDDETRSRESRSSTAEVGAASLRCDRCSHAATTAVLPSTSWWPEPSELLCGLHALESTARSAAALKLTHLPL